MWVNALGWTATAIFALSYFSKSARSLRLIQASAAVLWVVYGLAIHAAPVIGANLIVAAAAIFATFRRTPEATSGAISAS